MDDTTYSYSFWVIRNDGIEDSDKATTSTYSLRIPNFTLFNDNGEEAPFSKKVTVKLGEETTEDYSTVGFEGAKTEGLSLDTKDLDWGTNINKLLINNSFYVTLHTSLRKVYKIDIIPSNGKASPFSLEVFKIYTT
jgi:hypothetical protein